LSETVGQLGAVWRLRQVEQAGPDRPPVLIPFRSAAVSVAPGIRRIVECTLIDNRPIEKVVTRVVSVFVSIEDVDDRVFADRKHEAVYGLRAAELIQVGFELFGFAAEIDSLAKETALNQYVRRRFAALVSFAAGISRHAKGVA